MSEQVELEITSGIGVFTLNPFASFNAFHSPFEHQLEKEREWLAWCADHPNGREGIRAFLEKRSPVYNRGERKA